MFRWLIVAALVLSAGGAAIWIRARMSELEQVVEKPSTHLELPEQDREYLWDLEHHGNVLGQRGFKRLGQALQNDDRAAVLEVLAPDFTGEIADKAETTALKSDALDAIRKEADKFRTVPAGEFADWLLSHRRRFDTPPRVRFDVMKLTPPSRKSYDGN